MVLSILREKSKEDNNYIFDRLYRNLFNTDFYIRAYDKIYVKEGNMTPGIDNTTIDGFNIKIVEEIIIKMKSENYYPKPVRRTYIPKKNGQLRPLGIPSFVDKLVQEVVRQILEAIFEPIFLDTSHGFRQNKSCHTALHQIKATCKGTNWIIEGDIKGFFDNIDHEVLINLLGRKISDGRFLELIRRFLKAGYFEFKQVHNSLSGTPQGGIISPILANIYLYELDKYMEELIKENLTNNIRRSNPIYQRLNYSRCMANKKGDYDKAEELLRQMRKLHRLDQMDKGYIRVKYVRYADDFVVCIIGSKSLAEELREKIKSFLQNELKLELSLEKILITNLNDSRVKFLGYEIAKTRDNTVLTENSIGVKKRAANETIQLLIPGEVVKKKLEPFMRNGKAVHHNARINLPILDLINEYNAEIRGLYNYYCLATDVSTKLGKFKFYHYYSLAKTIARKEKCSVKKVIDRYGIDVGLKNGTGTRKIIGVKYQTKYGEKTMTYFNDSLKKVNQPKTEVCDRLIPQIPMRHQLIDRINANRCELCRKESDNNRDFEVHHVRKLKDIKQKYAKRGLSIPNWVLAMSSLNRKTLVVCEKCHDDIHAGNVNRSQKEKQ